MKITYTHRFIISVILFAYGAILICIYYLLSYLGVTHYLNANYNLLKNWFPKFYLPLFIVVKFFVTLVLTGIPLIFIYHAKHKPKYKHIITTGLLLCAYMLSNSFTGTKLIIATAISSFLLSAYQPISYFKIKYLHKVKESIYTKYYAGFTILLAYIIICITVPNDFHPFYKYNMYNSFEKQKIVISLKDTNGIIVPWPNHYKLSENGAYLIYKSLNITSNSIDSAINYGAIFYKRINYYKTKSIKKPLYITLTQINISNNSIQTNEHKIYRILPE